MSTASASPRKSSCKSLARHRFLLRAGAAMDSLAYLGALDDDDDDDDDDADGNDDRRRLSERAEFKVFVFSQFFWPQTVQFSLVAFLSLGTRPSRGSLSLLHSILPPRAKIKLLNPLMAVTAVNGH